MSQVTSLFPGGSPCASSSPEHPAGSARPSSPSCSPPATRSSASPARTPRPTTVAAARRRGPSRHLDDLDGLRAGAAARDGVVHLGYHHDFSQMAEAARDRPARDRDVRRRAERDRAAARHRLRRARARPRRVATERRPARPRPATRASRTRAAALALADRGVRSIGRALRADRARPGRPRLRGRARRASPARPASRATSTTAPTAGPPCTGSTPRASSASRSSRRPPARCCTPSPRRASRPARSPRRSAARLGVPAESIPAAQAAEHFGWIGGFFGMDMAASSDADARAARLGADAPGPARGPRGRQLRRSPYTVEQDFVPPCHGVSKVARCAASSSSCSPSAAHRRARQDSHTVLASRRGSPRSAEARVPTRPPRPRTARVSAAPGQAEKGDGSDAQPREEALSLGPLRSAEHAGGRAALDDQPIVEEARLGVERAGNLIE